MLGLSMAPSLRLALACSRCEQLIDDESQQSTMVCATLFGRRFYSVCWNCGQETSLRSARYRRWWLSVLVEKVTRSGDEALSWELARLLKTGAGYVPFARCLLGGHARRPLEFISYPYVERGRVLILVREVEKPWTLERKVPIEAAVPGSRTFTVTAVLKGILPVVGEPR